MNDARYSSMGKSPSFPSTTRASTLALARALCACAKIASSNPRIPSGPVLTTDSVASVRPPVSTSVNRGVVKDTSQDFALEIEKIKQETEEHLAGLDQTNSAVLEIQDRINKFDNLIKDGKKTSIYPIQGYWMDIGQMDEFNKAQSDYEDIFENED